jgi:hypothetical protein
VVDRDDGAALGAGTLDLDGGLGEGRVDVVDGDGVVGVGGAEMLVKGVEKRSSSVLTRTRRRQQPRGGGSHQQRP